MVLRHGYSSLIMKVSIYYTYNYCNIVRKTSIDTSLFWSSIYVTPVFWGVFLILDIIGLKLMWAIACAISLILSGSNTVGYYKCSGEQSKKISNFIMTKGTEQISNMFASAANKV